MRHSAGKVLLRLLPRRIRLAVIAARDRLAGRVLLPRMLYNYVRDRDGNIIEGVRISNTVALYHPENVRFARNVFVWHYTILDGTAPIDIGEGTQIGAWVGVFTHSSHVTIRLYGKHYRGVPEHAKKHTYTSPVRIGSYTFVGAQTIIMPGCTVGSGSIVSACSYVNSDVPDFAVVSGNPAKVRGDTRALDARSLRDDPELAAWYAEWSGALTRPTPASSEGVAATPVRVHASGTWPES